MNGWMNDDAFMSMSLFISLFISPLFFSSFAFARVRTRRRRRTNEDEDEDEEEGKDSFVLAHVNESTLDDQDVDACSASSS